MSASKSALGRIKSGAVDGSRGFGLADVNRYASPIASAAGDELADGIGAIPREKPRVFRHDVRTPEHDEVGAVPRFAQRAGHLAGMLHAENRGRMPAAGRSINHRPAPIGHGNRHALRLGGHARQHEDERVLCCAEQVRRGIDRAVERCWSVVDRGIVFLNTTILAAAVLLAATKKPCPAMPTGALRLDHPAIRARPIQYRHTNSNTRDKRCWGSAAWQVGRSDSSAERDWGPGYGSCDRNTPRSCFHDTLFGRLGASEFAG